MKTKSDFSNKKIINIIGKVLSWALFIILLIAAVFLLYYYVATKIYAAKGPGYEPKFSIYTIISGSMEPNIRVKDTVVNVRVKDPQDIVVGDVITFVSTSLLSPGTTITHRVVGITKDENGNVCYQTKGDNNPIQDQACAKFHNVIGKVILKIPQLGQIQFFLASKAGWLICIIVPALIIICRDIMRITKLTAIKKSTDNSEKKVDLKKKAKEAERVVTLKKKLNVKNMSEEVTLYYKDPDVTIVDRRKNKK